MGSYLNPGTIEFQESLNSEIYIDKTGLIEKTNAVLRTKQKFVCISRPRRFGKSMAADMLAAYYDRSVNTKELFQSLKIKSTKDYEKHLNQYDVIYLDPPFQLDLLPKILPLLPSRLSKSGIVYLESEYPFQQNDHWVILKCGRAGNVFFQLLKFEDHEQSNLPGHI